MGGSGGFSDTRRRNASVPVFLGLVYLFLVSEKVIGGGDLSFDWSNTLLSWQRTAFHFQPSKNWMNDPNGPFYYNGWYHLFYQYNPNAAVWGNIAWGHAVSGDLIHWFHLPNALLPDQPYDANGVWSGSATILPDGSIIMLYTGLVNETSQVQCLAVPANLSDPLLIEWVKHSDNPVLAPPPGIGKSDFRDPSTAWLTPDGDKWRIVIGSKINKTGIALVYETSDFVDYELLDGYLHAVPGTGMWECIDFYPVAVDSGYGSDTSAIGSGIKHVLKVSVYDDNHDYYTLGTYDAELNQWSPDDPSLDAGIGLRYDYGEYYASKSFYDQKTKRRILWGWVKETDTERVDIIKGWASVQTIPRIVVLDRKIRANLIQWPVEEVESLREESFEFNDAILEPGSIVPLHVGSVSQLDIEAAFEIEGDDVEVAVGVDSGYNCTSSGGAASRGLFGPFGIVVLATKQLSEFTPIYFYIAKQANGDMEYHFCADESRSSEALDVSRLVYGSSVPVLKGEKLTIRSLVDHSIVESFAQGGRRVITFRVYPTQVLDAPSQILLFNNATSVRVRASVKMWKMKSAGIRDLFCLDQAF